jgi:hypothetical protein
MIIQSVEKIYSRGILVGYSMIKNDKQYGVPLDPANSDYQAIQKWIKEGGTVIDNPPQENN